MDLNMERHPSCTYMYISNFMFHDRLSPSGTEYVDAINQQGARKAEEEGR